MASDFKKKNHARRLVYLSHKAGEITYPDHCSICGTTTARIYAHHDNYDRPLDVVFVCGSCHKRIHRGVVWSDGYTTDDYIVYVEGLSAEE